MYVYYTCSYSFNDIYACIYFLSTIIAGKLFTETDPFVARCW